MIRQFKSSTVRFEPSTGEFFWVYCHRKPWLIGCIATHETTNGYLYIKADGKNHSASRLAWELEYEEPVPIDMEIDHINRIMGDNRPCNLRVTNRKGNLENRVLSPGLSGHLGVSFYNRPSGNGFLYRARLGSATTYHETIEEAVAGYAKLAADRCKP